MTSKQHVKTRKRDKPIFTEWLGDRTAVSSKLSRCAGTGSLGHFTESGVLGSSRASIFKSLRTYAVDRAPKVGTNTRMKGIKGNWRLLQVLLSGRSGFDGVSLCCIKHTSRERTYE